MFPLPEGNLVDAFTRWLPDHAEAPAIIDGDDVISYGVLAAAMSRATATFAEAGWRPGSVVGLALSGMPAPLHLAAILGLARLGVVAIPLEPGEVTSAAGLALLRRHHAIGLVADSRIAPAAGLRVVCPQGAWLQDTGTPAVPSHLAAGGAMPWILLRTSGTTGTPKAFLQSHATCLKRHGITPASHRLSPGDRAMSLIDLCFYAGLRLALRCLFDGATLVTRPDSLNPEHLPEFAARQRVTSMLAAPAHLPMLLHGPSTDRPRFPALTEFLIGSSHVAEHVVRKCQRDVARNFFNLYGANEVGLISVAPPCQVRMYPDTVGAPLPGVQVEVVDPDGKRLPAGRQGEIRVRSAGMVTGYLDDPAANAQHFRDGWFYPGDLGMMSADGLLFLNGRTDDLMNYRGVLVAPPEIENVALDYLGPVELVAFSLPHATHGDVPILALGAKVVADERALLDHCRAKLGRKAPVAVVRVEALPRNLMGKPLRRVLSDATRRSLQNPDGPTRL
jgi:acyl-CoA synthetase (AMP-forming)/AMP-acid ligase II